MIVESQFKPLSLLANRHLQTLVGPLFVPVTHQPEQWQSIALEDDDFLELAWFGLEAQGPLLAIAHGLEGSYESHYIQRVLSRLLPANWQVVVMHFRSCGPTMNKKMRSYHSGSSDDLDKALEFISARQPGRELFALGFSLGGNVLLNWLGENPKQKLLRAAMAVSVPLLLHECASTMERGFARIYQKHLIDSLKKKSQLKLDLALPGYEMIAAADIHQLDTFWQFDDQITAPLHGFDGVHDYYLRASSFYKLPAIETPTLILHAQDDPFMSEKVIPESQWLSASTVMEVSQSGGHVGFIDQTRLQGDCFLARRVQNFFHRFF
ncbi:hydrolase [Pleionea sp. CnH1-48]|uniref:hydrolase n=1 Tax=Pleionea sp. CnH1-48 TaxID=2954494 RepID=UPI0020977630|nr:hydrolase [Pleionea sp. CnH1-48]